MNTYKYKYHGAFCKSDEAEELILHQLDIHFKKNEEVRTPICIWGTHGIGKTELVRQIAERKGYAFSYVAPAQFEEMGDLLGMPYRDEASQTTKFAPPEWVPKDEGPGILLIDDVNRADDRILRGIMQLLQNYELASWSLPKNWHIILTANPEGGDYSVTTMDEAMLTRMLHISMEFNVKTWARWATDEGVDPRGINFVLTYPEMMSGRLSTPRSMVQFFESIQYIDDLKANLTLVNTLALSCLDRNTAIAFTSFVSENLDRLIEPADILNSKNFKKNILPKIDKLVNQDTKRIDILSTISNRLVNHIYRKKITSAQIDNLKFFLKMDLMPEDLRLTLAQDLSQSNNSSLSKLFSDPEIAMLILSL